MSPIIKPQPSLSLTKDKLAELLAKARANRIVSIPAQQVTTVSTPAPNVIPTITTGMHGETITYNTNQAKCIQLAVSGSSLVLLGAAGTGKSTVQRGVVSQLIQSNLAGQYTNDGHKHLGKATAGIIICAYTRRAINNIRKVMPEDMKDNCITIHKLLEYAPVYYDSPDGSGKRTMQFEPTRNFMHPLSHSIHTIIIEESSMVAVELFQQLTAALHHKVQFIFIGDIQQLPPVFGSAILGFKMLELPVVELTEVYRQALESPIIRLAHRILSGNPIPADQLPEWEFPGKLKLHPWKKKLSEDLAILTLAKFFQVAMDAGEYKPDEDMILIPFNKSVGTDELNKQIAQHISTKESRKVHEVIAGFNKHYYAVGDKVMYEKEDAVITAININGLYVGTKYLEASTLLDRWGTFRQPADTDAIDVHVDAGNDTCEDIDALLDSMSFTGGDDAEDRKRESSHSIHLQLLESGEEVIVSTASAVNAMSLGYCLTVHKAQGSESRKVFVLLHESHATMLCRELLYTAVTRARESLYVICPPDAFVKGITRQRIVGNTLAEKATYFQGKLDRKEQQQLAV